jgi:hypothetical protein
MDWPARGDVAPQGDALFHVVLLGVASCVLAAACLLRVEGTEKVWVPVVERPLPGLCTYQRLFGIGCPGCGLTRCFISMAHGHLGAAWRFNPAGLLLFAVVVVQLPYRAWQLWRIRRGLAEIRLGQGSHLLFWSCFAALISQWVVRTFILPYP